MIPPTWSPATVGELAPAAERVKVEDRVVEPSEREKLRTPAHAQRFNSLFTTRLRNGEAGGDHADESRTNSSSSASPRC